MGVLPENTCLSRETEPPARGEDPVPAQPPVGEHLRYNDLLREYNQLRERSLRTTNALASAAHDLKTPLAILNGYVELLQKEKLGPLNDRQREILGDMHTSGQPRPKAAPPTLESPWWKDVTPPARMQMIESDSA